MKQKTDSLLLKVLCPDCGIYSLFTLEKNIANLECWTCGHIFSPEDIRLLIKDYLGDEKSLTDQDVLKTNNVMTSAREYQEDRMVISLSDGVELTMIKVKADTFEMSARDGENRFGEIPHLAKLTLDFFIGQTAVTQSQWQAVMGNNPSNFQGDNYPVEMVSWNDAMDFCEKLNIIGKAPSGWMFILPTETQWEYAARGGCKSKGYKYSGSNNLSEVAWYLDNSDRKPHPVGLKKANELDLYDMSGNMDEWCLDDWINMSDKLIPEFVRGNDRNGLRVRRGGSLLASAYNCRPADRGNNSPNNPNDRHFAIGFRLALIPAHPGFQEAAQ